MRDATARIDELDAVPGPDSLTWRPVGAHFDLRAFGCNAYTVLPFGGPPTFEPSAWEWSFRAEPLMETDPERARAILEDGARALPDSANLHYAFARLEARQGNRDAALAAAREALALAPDAQREELLADMRAHPALAAVRDRL